MNFKSKIVDKILNESIESRIEEISKKIGEIQEVDNFDLEVGSEYEYKKDEDSKPKMIKFLKRGKNSSHGPFYFLDRNGNEIMLGEKQLKKMEKKYTKQEETEGDAFTKKLKDTPKGEKFKMGNKKYTDNSSLEEMIHSELEEKLYGGQKKLDKNHNGRIDSEDFKMLRKGKKSEMDEDLAGMHDVFGDVNLSKIPDEEKQEGGKFAKYYRNPLSLKDNRKDDEEEEDFGTMRSRFFDKEDQEDEFDNMTESVKSNDVVYNVTFGNENVSLTETEMVDLIEEIVKEEATKSSTPGIAKYQKISRDEKSQNEKALKDVAKKMKDYIKDGSKGEYNENPNYFPKGNGELAKMDKKAYIPSKDVDEYVDAFAYPGMTNLVFDEIKPDDEKIEKYIKGDSTTGNSQEYANAVKTEVGEKFYKNYEENLYGAEQMKASYKRQNQPVDIAGETTPKSNKKSSKKSSSIGKANKILNNLDETVQNETDKLLSEEMLKMKKLISY